MSKFTVTRSDTPTPADEVSALLENPGFAVRNTDHMATARWADGKWSDFAITPYKALELDPRAMALHYGQAIFEGMKAFACPDGSVSVFRAEANAERLVVSAERMAMPPLPVDTFLQACDELIRTDQRWIPTAKGTSLYLRPYMFATEAHIGVRAAVEFEFVVIALPAAPLFSSTFDAISVAVMDNYVRAARGGTGEAKCAGNYAASLLAKNEAKALGCSEVLWLDAAEHTYIEELSGMNVFVVEGSGDSAKLITPPLNGTILRGITRDSILQVGAALGYGVEEREISIDEISKRAASGEITEAFACGTAAVIAPIGSIRRREEEIQLADGKPGATTTRLYNELVAIQEGRSSQFPEWRHVVEGASVTPGM